MPTLVEPLEGRALLSAAGGLAARPPTSTVLAVEPSSVSVDQERGAFTATVSLKEMRGGRALLPPDAAGLPAATLVEPLTVDFIASLTPPNPVDGEAAEAEDPYFATVRESVTIPAGASAATVTVPIVSREPVPGPQFVYLSATPASPSSGVSSGGGMVTLYSGPDAVPPTITSVRPLTHGGLATGVEIGFSKPMDPATAGDARNYRILSRPELTSRKGFLWWNGSTTRTFHSFPIASADYDPVASTVTLSLRRPARASSLYEVANAFPRGQSITDLQGRPIDGGTSFAGGEFTVMVHPDARASLSPRPVRGLEITVPHSEVSLIGGLGSLMGLRMM